MVKRVRSKETKCKNDANIIILALPWKGLPTSFQGSAICVRLTTIITRKNNLVTSFRLHIEVFIQTQLKICELACKCWAIWELTHPVSGTYCWTLTCWQEDLGTGAKGTHFFPTEPTPYSEPGCLDEWVVQPHVPS